MSQYTEQIKQDWVTTAPYYELAEKSLWPFWSEDLPFLRMFKTLDLTNAIDLACGHGRHTAYIRENFSIGQITLVDINEPNIAFCRSRFAGDNRLSYLVNSGSDLAPLESDFYSAVFCYDAMVHFEYDDVFSYLKDIYRVLRPAGMALLHHSNNDKEPGSRYFENRCWRNFMSSALFMHAAMRTGLSVIEQQVIDWAGEPEVDCITLLAKPDTGI